MCADVNAGRGEVGGDAPQLLVTMHPLQGATEKKPRKNDVHLRQLAKKNTYVLFF
jgi:hypothetical protein